MIKKLSLPFIFGIILLLSSCESTGICTEPVTPKLMIGFSDFDNLGNPEDIEPPSDLKIYGTKDGTDIGTSNEDNFIFPGLTETDENKRIALIFDVNRDSLTYIFKFEGDIFDTLRINYIRENRYINKKVEKKLISSTLCFVNISSNQINS